MTGDPGGSRPLSVPAVGGLGGNGSLDRTGTHERDAAGFDPAKGGAHENLLLVPGRELP